MRSSQLTSYLTVKKQKLSPALLSDHERLTGAAMLSGGSIGKAMQLLSEDETKSEPLRMRTLALHLLEGIFKMHTSQVLVLLAAEQPGNRESAALVFTMLQSALRDLITRKRNADVLGRFLIGTEDVCRFAGKYSLSRLMALYACCQTALDRLNANGPILPCMTSFVLQAKRI